MTEEVIAQPAAEVTKPKPAAVVKTVKTFVYDNLKVIESALPRIGLTAESVARTALSQVYRNPVLETCDKTSLIRAIIEAASLGLSFALGRAYLVPFNNKHEDPVTGQVTWRMEAQFMPGYQGLVDLVRRSADVKSVVAAAVFEGDEFAYSTDLEGDTLHYKKLAEDTSDAKLTHAFCIIRFLDGGYQWVVLDRKKLDKVRATSKAGSGPTAPWVAWYEEQCIKSAVKRATKLCPASIELARAIELDDDAEIGRRQPPAIDVPLVGVAEPAQITGGTAAIDAVPAQTVTQKVSGAAAEVLKMARAGTPSPEKTAEQPAEQGPGRGRPKKCPACKTNSLKSVIEREAEKCDACRQAETNAIRDAQGTSVAAVTAVEPAGEAPQAATEPDDITKLAQRLRFAFMTESEGNLAEAEISLSSLTGGKVQKFEKLADYLLATPGAIEKVAEVLAK